MPEQMLAEIRTRLRWRYFAVALSAACYLGGLRLIEIHGEDGWRGSFVQELVYLVCASILVLLAALAADLQVEKGATPWKAYLRWLLGAALVASLVRYEMREILQACCGLPRTPGAPIFHFLRVIISALDVIFTGGFFMLAFYNRRAATRALEAIRAADLQRRLLERRVIDSRLEAAAAEIDPQELFAAMARIREGLQSGSVSADTGLDELIQKLRNRKPVGFQA